jgi:hypothetical protein
MTSLQAQLHRFVIDGEGYFNWGIDLLRQIGLSATELLPLERFCREEYAPAWAEMRVKNLLSEAYYSLKLDVSSLKQSKITNVPTSNFQLPTKKDPAVIVALRDERQGLMKLRADWHSRLYFATKKSDRADCAEQILTLTTQLQKLHAALDAFTAHGIIPPLAAAQATAAAPTAASELAALQREKESVAPRISKIKQLLRGADGERKNALESELAEKEVRLLSIKSKLKSSIM